MSNLRLKNHTWDAANVYDSTLGKTQGQINTEVGTSLAGKQGTLVSGENIKTVNGASILGSGNIEIQGGGSVTVDDEMSASSENPVQNKVITGEVNALKNATINTYRNDYIIPVVLSGGSVESGGIADETGKNASNNTRARTGFVNTQGKSSLFFEITNSDYVIASAWFYSDASNTSGTRAIAINIDDRHFVCKPENNDGYFRVSFRNLDNTALDSDDYTAIRNSIKIYQQVDRTLSIDGVAANAKITGDMLSNLSKAIDYQCEKEQLTNAWESGAIKADGSTSTNNARIRFVSYIKVDVGMQVIVPDGMKVSAAVYDSNNVSSFVERTDYIDKNITYYYPNKYIKLIAGYTDGSAISVSAGKSIIRYNLISTANKFTDSFDRDSCVVEEDISLESGAIKSADGSQTPNSTRVRSINYIPIWKKIKVTVPSWLKMKIAYYHEQSYLTFEAMEPTDSWATGEVVIQPEKGDYCRLVLAFSDDSNIQPEMVYNTRLPITHYYGAEYIKDELVYDAPKSLGALNCVQTARQIYALQYRLAAILPNQAMDFPAGLVEKGIPYSSARYENLYVPNCVSYDSFMTAAMNPNSYLYTRVVTAADGETRLGNSETYFGTVCSSLISQCLGFEGIIYTTHQLGELAGIVQLEEQNCYALEPGDLLLKADDHIAIVAGIGRNKNGKIERVEIIDAWPPFVRRRLLSISTMNTQYFAPSKGYKAYRYSGIKNAVYTPTPWVHLDGESEEPTYNANLCPRRGDKSVWPAGETVEIDILDAGSYTSYKLYKDNTLVSTADISGSILISLDSLAYGNYKLCLTDGTNDSDFVYWIVVADPQISVTYLGDKTVRAAFSCENAEATSIAWCRDCPSNVRHWYAVYDTTPLTDAEKTAGVVENTYSGSDWDSIVSSDSGKWYIRFMWKTDYGYFSRKYVEIDVT